MRSSQQGGIKVGSFPAPIFLQIEDSGIRANQFPSEPFAEIR